LISLLRGLVPRRNLRDCRKQREEGEWVKTVGRRAAWVHSRRADMEDVLPGYVVAGQTWGRCCLGA